MLRILRVLAIAAVFFLPSSSPKAAWDLETSSISGSSMELLVVELDGCIYCLVFRRDVLPSYQASTQAKTVPIRFIELNAAEEQKFPFAEPVTMVPTILLMKGGREVGRISGYLGPENFFHAVNHMISAAP